MRIQVTAGFTGRFSTFSKPDIASTVYITTKQKFELLCFLVYHKMVKIGTANFLPECICLSQRLDMTVEIAAWNKHSCIRVKKILLRDGLFENTSKLCYPIPNNGCRWWRNTHIFHKILGKSDFVLAPGQPVSIKTESDETAK